MSPMASLTLRHYLVSPTSARIRPVLRSPLAPRIDRGTAYFFAIFAQESRSVDVRLKTGAPGLLSTGSGKK